MAFHGRGILDNPKAIYLEFISEQRFEDYSIIWVLNDKTKELITRGKTVRYQSLFYFYYLAKSKYWIVNCKLPEYVHKKKDQIYIQTWHGVPLKKIGMDVVENFRQKSRSGRNAVEIKQSYFLDAQRYNYMISPNSFCTRVFQSRGKRRIPPVEPILHGFRTSVPFPEGRFQTSFGAQSQARARPENDPWHSAGRDRHGRLRK